HFSYVEALVGKAEKKHRLCVVLTGDSHHYSRYTEETRHYITAGGGGAFTHPTHHLRCRDFAWGWPTPGSPRPDRVTPGQPSPPRFRRTFRLARDEQTNEPRVFPPRGASSWIAWRNVAFAFYNWDYALALAVGYAIFTWLISVNARVVPSTLPEILTR